VALIPQTRHRHLAITMVENGSTIPIDASSILLDEMVSLVLQPGTDMTDFEMTRVIILASDRECCSRCFDLANTCFHKHSSAEQQANAQTSTAKA
jgi:hypothetical protein